MASLLRVENLNVRYRTQSRLQALVRGQADRFVDAVCGVSFALERGQTLGLVGESGSGKSTIARAIAGLLPRVSGTIEFEGTDLVPLAAPQRRAYRRDIALMFQDPVGSLSPRLKVSSLITEPFRIHGHNKGDIKSEARRLLELVGLSEDFGGRYPHQLSGGQARRVGVARALALNPKLLIADEPTAGLDVSIQGEVLNLLRRLQREQNLAILMITHNLNIVRHISDHMAIMYLGRFPEFASTDDIFRQPRHPYTEALLSANPIPDPDVQHNRVEIKGEVPSLSDRPCGCEFHPRCPYAGNKCETVVPKRSYLAPGHSYTCHFPLGMAAKAS